MITINFNVQFIIIFFAFISTPAVKSKIDSHLLAPTPTKFKESKLIGLTRNIFALNISIGYPLQSFLLLVDTVSDYTWVRGTKCIYCSYVGNIFNETESYSLIFPENSTRKNIKDIRGFVEGEIAYDDICLEGLHANKVEFLIASDDEFLEFADGILGLGFPPQAGNGGQYSFLQKLYTGGEIKERIFSFNFTDELAPSFLIGKMPANIDPRHYFTCSIYSYNNQNWNCMISHILFGDDYNFYKAVKLNHVIANFATGVHYIYVPFEFLDMFMNNYIKTFPKYFPKLCFTKADSNSAHILCDRFYLSTIQCPSLNLIINGHAYRLTCEELFEDVFADANMQYMILKIEFTNTSLGQWYLGTVFFKQHQIIFNGEKKEIGFYSGFQYDFTKFTNEKVEAICLYNILAYCFLFLIVVLSMGYIIWTRKKKDEMIINDFIRRVSG